MNAAIASPFRLAIVGAFALLAIAPARAEQEAPKKEPTPTPTPPPALSAILDKPAGHASMSKGPQATPVPRKDFAATLAETGKHKTLIELLGKSGLAETLKRKGPYTLFAPTDEAFAKLPKAELDALKADPARLKSLLNYHLVNGRVLPRDLHKGAPRKTAHGGELEFKPGTGKSVFIVNDAEIGRIYPTLNGAIIEIRGVLAPKSK